MTGYITAAQIRKNLLAGKPRQRFIIPSVLPAGPCLLFGSSGSGKTGVSVRTAVAVAAGLEWAGRAVVRGSVLYVAGEDFNGVQDRIAAACQQLGVSDEGLPLGVMESNPEGFVSDSFRNEVEIQAGKLHREFDLPVALVVIDTLAACFGPKSQDDATAASEYMNNADKLSRRLSCSVLSIHHTGKNENSGMRGSRVFFDRADSVIEVKKGKGKGFMQVEKLRNEPSGARFTFEIAGADVMVAGGPISVQVIKALVSSSASEKPSKEEQKASRDLTDAAVAMMLLSDLSISGDVSLKQWQDACASQWQHKPTDGARRTAFSTVRKKLVSDGKITINGDTVSVSVSGKHADTSANNSSPDAVSVSVSTTPFIRGVHTRTDSPDPQEQESAESSASSMGEGTIAKANAFARGHGGETPGEDSCAAADADADARPDYLARGAA
ncbi:AAA family ATPase [Rhizobium sp. PP-CC-3G-465]|uniref:AAA family ATPase n=1 Tax=Rhizobium sp. PP-CC-3G-465 TaxID=2135648 RepID=UPI0010525E43|nr:AAA domain-containing protein [Rhizobium sp. PP-CC-3G-465]